MIVRLSSASGSIWDGGAVVPAVRAAIRNVATWPATTSADVSAIAGDDFYNALLRIWIGDKPVDADLKKGMLGA